MTRPIRRSQFVLSSLLLVMLYSLTWTVAPVPATAAAAANEQWCPPQTSFCAENAFLDYWRTVDQATGGYALDILGLPISPARRKPNGQIVQFYERAVLEWHPENADPRYQVLLAQLGRLLSENNPRTQQPPVACAGACVLIPQTNHTLRDPFLAYWNSQGGLAVYGYPLTEEYQERNAGNGQPYTVQWFERNRFEYHPENPDPRYQVQLGRLGAELLALAGAEVGTWPQVRTPNYSGAATPPPPATSDEALIAAAADLIRGVPSAAYIPDTLAARNIPQAFEELPSNVNGYIQLRANATRVAYSTKFRSRDPHNLAATMGHEGQHGYDYFTLGNSRSASECYAFELRGFLTQAFLWQSWYGPNGKADPANEYEQAMNERLRGIKGNPNNFAVTLVEAYNSQCAYDGPGGPDRFLTLSGLPAGIDSQLPVQQLFAGLRGVVGADRLTIAGVVDPILLQALLQP